MLAPERRARAKTMAKMQGFGKGKEARGISKVQKKAEGKREDGRRQSKRRIPKERAQSQEKEIALQ